MSQKNVDIVKAAFAAWNAGDMDAFREFYDPDAVLRGAEGWPEPGPFLGREAIMRQWEQQRDAFDTDAVEPISFIDIADRVVVREIWRGAGSGPEMNLEITNVMTVRKGRIVYQEFFWDHAEALETVGLLEPSNVELVRSICEGWGEGDFSSAEWAHPEIEFVMTGGPVDGSWTGLAGMTQGWGAWLGAWEDFRAKPEKYHEVDDERVLVLLHGTARGKTSGMELGEMRTKTATLFHLHGGKVTRMVVYLDRERALAELGLPSEANSSPT